MWGGLGLTFMWLIGFKLNYKVFLSRRFINIIYFGTLLLLLAVDVTGKVVNGSRRWLYIGGFSLQPAPEISRVLGVNLPLLWLVLLLIEAAGPRAVDANAPEGDAVDALIQLSQCYRSAMLLLLAGFFWTYDTVGAVLAAVLLQGILAIVPKLPLPWREPLSGSWGLAYFAAGLNVCWLYLKFWL